MILLAAVMIAGCAVCNAQIKQNSEKAAQQAKSGNTTQAASTASKTWQNDRLERSTPGSSNLNDIVSKKADEARSAAQRESVKASGTTSSSTSGSSSTGNNNSGTTKTNNTNTSGTTTQTNKK